MYKQRVTQTLTVLAAAGLLAACGSESGSGDSDTSGKKDSGSVGSKTSLTGVRWNVESLTVDGKKQKAPDDVYVRLGGKGGTGGHFGCNGYGADVSVKGDTVRFKPGVHTQMACEALDFENSLARAIDGKLKASVDDDRLTLTNAKGDRIALTSRPVAPGAPLQGTTWTVDSVGTGDSARPLPKQVAGKAKLIFGKDGTVRGNLGCNDVTGKAEAHDGALALGAPKLTRMMCVGPKAKTESDLLKLFDGKAEYEVKDDGLTLTAEDGTVVSATATLSADAKK
ncbi:META domain-containing protein [Streptomyces spectabilis]|uniref:Heat shock protein HslJ n=1 Tax=Streptomyces spectabilis TaxID=68270 RepID=A0A5P2XC04_STRST|nr:META domain-containing protein [Streptomyces spectabilis]MBB5104104.1 heat shock protein HslJ [Streptomyces spectabilis]MCI3903665.1 META domain-containing protein [Streptomyces spectabilis]QEV60849.1 META domain-containing protein [Streptomyces spectabilis]GGV39752.1 lipoprotein [Streptomyces spectabilis]